jgi:hypothetical protein
VEESGTCRAFAIILSAAFWILPAWPTGGEDEANTAQRKRKAVNPHTNALVEGEKCIRVRKKIIMKSLSKKQFTLVWG